MMAHQRARDDEVERQSGCVIVEGPPFRISFHMFGSYEGLSYIQLYLWLLKDLSWSMINWPYPTIIFGGLAVIVTLFICIRSYNSKTWSFFWVDISLLLWLLMNYSWCVGETWRFSFHNPSVAQISTPLCKVLGSASVCLFMFYLAVVVPKDWFKRDRDNEECQQILRRDPVPRFACWLREYRNYEVLHMLFWAIKDLAWVCDLFYVYAVSFSILAILSFDQCYLLITRKHLYVDFINRGILTYMWVVANGVWAYGEVRMEHLDDRPPYFEDFMRSYSIVKPLPDEAFVCRFVANWIFIGSLFTAALFYVHWILLTLCGDLPTYEQHCLQNFSSHLSRESQIDSVGQDYGGISNERSGLLNSVSTKDHTKEP